MTTLDLTLILAAVAALASVAALIAALTRKPKTDPALLSLSRQVDLLSQKLDLTARAADEKSARLTEGMNNLTQKNYEQQVKLLETLNDNNERSARTLSAAIQTLQEGNEKKLEEMRKTVDEKLTETLNNRLSASFRTVSEQLQNVYKSLGEMKELSAGVTDNVKGLNRVLTNVKSRGTWAEVQLGNILDQTLPVGMYEKNVKTNPKYNGQVEFAVKIPSAQDESVTWLPIDSKFPMEDYIRLCTASEEGDLEGLAAARKALEATVRSEAKAIRQYISSPETTPFAILYLATEGLYAEIMSSRSGIAERLQQEGVMIAGPSTVTALLNSLAMGFRTMAINQKAEEVWKVLGAAKSQYDKFAELLQKARKKMDEAGRALDDADHRNSIIQKNLRAVETLDAGEGETLLGLQGTPAVDPRTEEF